MDQLSAAACVIPDSEQALFGPLLAPPRAADGCLVLGRLAQSLDGFIATRGGESHWIGGEADLLHTHRLRALFDAVVVGAGTVRADNPRLTTRLVPGPDPVRVVLDPGRRLDTRYHVFGDGPPTLLVCAEDAIAGRRHGAAEVVRVARQGDALDVHAIVAALGMRGLRRIFIEGGGVTVSRFLLAGALDRLHITLAPLLMGDGIPALPLPPVGTLSAAPRFDWVAHALGRDVLLDVTLASRRGEPEAAQSSSPAARVGCGEISGQDA